MKKFILLCVLLNITWLLFKIITGIAMIIDWESTTDFLIDNNYPYLMTGVYSIIYAAIFILWGYSLVFEWKNGKKAIHFVLLLILNFSYSPIYYFIKIRKSIN